MHPSVVRLFGNAPPTLYNPHSNTLTRVVQHIVIRRRSRHRCFHAPSAPDTILTISGRFLRCLVLDWSRGRLLNAIPRAKFRMDGFFLSGHRNLMLVRQIDEPHKKLGTRPGPQFESLASTFFDDLASHEAPPWSSWARACGNRTCWSSKKVAHTVHVLGPTSHHGSNQPNDRRSPSQGA